MKFTQAQEWELSSARQKFSKQVSFHEGLAIIWEEFEELKTEVFKKTPDRVLMKNELVQLAAMCQRMCEDVVE
jgi:hypothetical protein